MGGSFILFICLLATIEVILYSHTYSQTSPSMCSLESYLYFTLSYHIDYRIIFNAICYFADSLIRHGYDLE